jgi:cation diffusion facilitator CzcD-associated flavoprotein CzcO
MKHDFLDPHKVAQEWLTQFESALAGPSPEAMGALFDPDCHWRDLLALDWEIITHSGVPAVSQALLAAAPLQSPKNFRAHLRRQPAQWVQRAGREVIEAFIEFETSVGPCEGILRLSAQEGSSKLKAWTLMTCLVEVAGHEEKYKRKTDPESKPGRTFLGANWLEKREKEARFEDAQPSVLVIGAGQAGLSIAARLRQLDISCLVVDRNPRVGDNWRHRYHALVLHNQRTVNHLPYMPFPEVWPEYLPKDMVAGWFEYYAQAMELNVWCNTEFVTARFDPSSAQWQADLVCDGAPRRLTPRHIIMATGVSAIPDRSPVEGLQDFEGVVMHSADYSSALPWVGKNVVVLGTGTSGHDVAQDLCEHGAHVTMVQRSPTMVQNVAPTAQLPYVLYGQEMALEDCDLISVGTPMALYRAANRHYLDMALDLDKDTLDGLSRAGFRLNKGEDGNNWQMMYLTRGGGYYFNVGCSELIIQKRIKLLQADDIERYEATGVRLKSGALLPAELVVTAKGYLGQSQMVEKLFGPEMAERVGPIWGVDERTQELRNMWNPTPQPGLWFHAGSFAQCRILSKYLALQIQASELGLRRQ